MEAGVIEVASFERNLGKLIEQCPHFLHVESIEAFGEPA
jgi:hypothetical protein